MKTSIETIGGKLCTVIRKPFDAEWVREQLAMGVPVLVEAYAELLDDGFLPGGEELAQFILPDWDIDQFDWVNTLTILPALPKHPTLKHNALIFRYMAEGVFPVVAGIPGHPLDGECVIPYCGGDSHFISGVSEGSPVGIAIEGEE